MGKEVRRKTMTVLLNELTWYMDDTDIFCRLFIWCEFVEIFAKYYCVKHLYSLYFCKFSFCIWNLRSKQPNWQFEVIPDRQLVFWKVWWWGWLWQTTAVTPFLGLFPGVIVCHFHNFHIWFKSGEVMLHQSSDFPFFFPYWVTVWLPYISQALIFFVSN